jgi:hypothetical protein
VRKSVNGLHNVIPLRFFKNGPGLQSFSNPTSQGLPKKKEVFGKKGPISYKTLLVTAGLSGSLLAFMLYVRKEKEAGIFYSFSNKIVINI